MQSETQWIRVSVSLDAVSEWHVAGREETPGVESGVGWGGVGFPLTDSGFEGSGVKCEGWGPVPCLRV